MNSIILNFGEWMQARGYLSQASADAYMSDCSLFEVWLMDYRLNYRWSMVNQEDIEDYIEYLVSKKYEYSSICRILSSLSSLFGYFVKRGLLQSNPVSKVQRPRPSYHTREALSMDIVYRVLQQSGLADSTRALISLISESGLRIGECLKLTSGDIDLESRQIRVTGKGRTYRMAFFGDMTAQYLERYISNRRFSGSIFPLSRRQYNWDIYHACKPFAGEHKCSPHILRHTFATECLSKGMPMDVLMLTLGHKSIDTTMLYTHCQSSRVEKFNRLNSARL